MGLQNRLTLSFGLLKIDILKIFNWAIAFLKGLMYLMGNFYIAIQIFVTM